MRRSCRPCRPRPFTSRAPARQLGTVAGSGLEARRHRLSAALTYSLERYDFPAVLRAQDGVRVRRLEQLSTPGLRLGVGS